ncbi:MAG: hypothetical protein ACHQM6_03255 [Candidatus Kapaibacterium sp.]
MSKYCPLHSEIIIDNSAGAWAYPRSMQTHFPAQSFIQRNPIDTSIVSLFFSGVTGSEINRAYPVSAMLQKDTIYYFIDPRYVNIFGAPADANILSSGSYVSLYRTVAKSKELFWKYCTKVQ